ncbi:hypothetical protein [Tenacibaculum sp. 1_MG-2023]|uniref:hypothetical protein n=1 Tax=Tenacibaculum sp. 1_MG-2023 TaxID=3062653 RepID=UPI0026E2C899|nr:hypothetical protein [Tenacibaculum sp. 1_MG-2023]MDO6600253.1 hypothetical protein [Tenacibaculum sp. 1_MG-2023]
MSRRFLTKILTNKETTELDYIQEIDEDKYISIKKSIGIVDEVHNSMDLFLILQNNYNEIANFQETHIEKFIKNINEPLNIHKDDYTRLKIEINRVLQNYLSSVRMFVDHCDANLNRRFGKESAEYLNFKQTLSKFYDNNFEYRFIYKLRNFCQHCGLPVSDFSIDNYQDFITLELNFNSEYLLSEYDSWKADLKKDLIKINGMFSATKVISNHFKIMFLISQKIHSLYEKIFLGALTTLNFHTKEHRDEFELIIVTENNSTTESKNITITKFPFEIIDKFIKGIC